MAKGDTQTQQQNQTQQQSGTSSSTSNTAQNQNTTGNSATGPWAATQPLLNDLISRFSALNPDVTGPQVSAVNDLVRSTQTLPNFGGAASGAVNNLFNFDTAPQVGMLRDAYGNLQTNIGGTAAGNDLDPYKTPGFSDALNTMISDITKNVKNQYAAAGRDPSGAGSFAGSLGRGLTQGLAPTIASQFNTNKTNQLNAANTLFNAGSGTAGAITGQETIPLNLASSAIGMLPSVYNAYTSPAASAVSAANVAQSLPLSNLSALLSPVGMLAGLGSQTSQTGTSTGTSAGSGSNTTQSSGSSAGYGTTTQPQSLLSNILGGVAGAAGLSSLLGGGGAAGASSLLPLLALSDEREKTDIKQVGMLNDGQPVHRFRYKGSPKMQIGLLAQQVEKKMPDAVHTVGGRKMVDYRHATERAAA
jgi:hypothetical protein